LPALKHIPSANRGPSVCLPSTVMRTSLAIRAVADLVSR
jgi:hypothetical protein